MSAAGVRPALPTLDPQETTRVRCVRLGKRFGSYWAVRDLELDLVPGEVFGLLGPNGAGKSTTIRLLMGMLRATEGSAWVCGHRADDVATAHRDIGFVPAEVSLWPQLTGREHLELLARIGATVDLAYRDELLERFVVEPDRRAASYSTGNRQKIALVAAFATRAPVLIMDEPTSGLDPLMEREFRACVAEARDHGQTVLLSSHQLSEVEAVCDRVGIIRSGRLIEVAGLADLRRLRQQQVTVTFASDEADLSGLAGQHGVVDEPVRVAAGRWVVPVSGPIGPTLRWLADADPVSLQVREPSLEEIFLSYYGSES